MSNVDNAMLKATSGWKFDETVVPSFESHVRKSVPFYDQFHKMVADIFPFFVERGTNVYDLGTSTGETITRLLPYGPEMRFIGVDNSVDMVSAAHNKFRDNPNVEIALGNVEDDRFIMENANFVTAVLTVQFIPMVKRLAVIRKIYEGMNKKGAFILIEKVLGSTAQTNDIFVQLHHDSKIENGLDADHVIGKARSIRGVMRPLSVDDNIQLLEASGFSEVECFFRWYNWAGIIAIK